MRLLGVVVGALVWPLLAWAGTATAADSDRPRQVLLLCAESRLLPGLVEADAAFRSTVASSPDAPVDSVGDLTLPRDVTGVLMTLDWLDTLAAALRLQPETRRVVVVSGTSVLDRRWVAAARVAFADAPAHLEFAYVTDLPLEAVAARLAALPDGTIVFLIGFLRDSTGRNLRAQEALKRLVERSVSAR